MDSYWQAKYELLPDGHFISQDTTTWMVVTISTTPGSPIAHSFKQEILSRDSLRAWAQTGYAFPGQLTLLCRCLIVSTHDWNDFPVDIDRNDLAYVARCLGIGPAYLSLLFSGYTGYSMLDTDVTWYYGRPGLRAIAATDAAKDLTNAIVTINGDSMNSFIRDIELFSAYANHPFMFVLAMRASTLDYTRELLFQYVQSLREAETLTGFDTDESSFTSDGENSVGHHNTRSVDLARLTRMVGSGASNLGNFKVVLAGLESLHGMLHRDSSQTTWQTHFKNQNLYLKRSNDIIEADSAFESARQGLLRVMTEYQDRARNLQSVIFNLIPKEDANASIALAKESRAIATATRHDGMSMKTIAVMTMIFLPATFFAALFAVPLLQWQQSPVIQRGFWIYWAFTIPSTLTILFVWKIFVSRQIARDLDNGTASSVGPRPGRSSRTIFGNLSNPPSKMLPILHRDKEV